MKTPHNGLPSWLLPLAGLVLCLALGHWQAQAASQRVVDYGLAHAHGGAQGLLVWLYDNPFLTGPARASLQPPPRIHKDRTPTQQRDCPFSWRWLGMLEVPRSGTYLLGVYASEAIRLNIDGRPVIQRWGGSPPRHEQALVKLEAGAHLLDLANVQDTHSLHLALYWVPPGGTELQPIPIQALRPLDSATSSASLEELYGNVECWRALLWLLPCLWVVLWWVIGRYPERSLALPVEHGPFLLILAGAGTLMLLWGNIVPGISGESAFYMWRAELITEGARPFQGMITRNGPFLEYLLTLPLMIFGATPWVLQGTGAVLNLLAMVFCYRVFDREAGRPMALLACLLMACTPALVMFARVTIDYTALNPLLFFWGLDLLSRSRLKPPLSLAAGILWGLGFFNHSIFVVFPVTLGLAALVVSRLRILLYPQIYGLAVGMLLAFLPRIVNRILLPQRQEPMSFFDPGRLKHLLGFTDVFWQVLDGTVLYKLYTGQLLWDTQGLLAWVAVAGGVFLLWGLLRRRDQGSWLEMALGIALATFLLMAPVGAPTANPRYLTHAALLATLLLARAWDRAWQWSPRQLKPLIAVGVGAYLALCLTSLGINFYHGHLSTGGRPLAWDNPLLDHVSDAWMNHRDLARELAKRGYPVVATGDFWHHTLHLALNLYQEAPLVFRAVSIASRSNTERAAVFYNSAEGQRRLRFFLEGNPGKIFIPVSLGTELDKKYLLVERTWPPVGYPSDLEGAW